MEKREKSIQCDPLLMVYRPQSGLYQVNQPVCDYKAHCVGGTLLIKDCITLHVCPFLIFLEGSPFLYKSCVWISNSSSFIVLEFKWTVINYLHDSDQRAGTNLDINFALALTSDSINFNPYTSSEHSTMTHFLGLF